MGRGFFWSGGEEGHHAGTEADLTENNSTSTVHGCGTQRKQVRQPVLALHCLRQVGGSVYMLRVGGRESLRLPLSVTLTPVPIGPSSLCSLQPGRPAFPGGQRAEPEFSL